MSEAVPPSALPAPAHAPQPQSAPSEPAGRGIVVQLPPSLAAPLPVGETLEGVVAARLTASRIAVTTRLGRFVLQTDFAPAQGARIVLQITSQGAQPVVNIVPNHQTPAPAGSQSGRTPEAAINTAPANAAATQAGKTPATFTTASVATVRSDGANQIRGSVLSATILRAFRGTEPQSGVSRPTEPQSGVSRPQAAVGAPEIRQLLPGTRLAFRVAAVTRPGTGAPPATPGTPSLTGTVTGTDPSGNAIVRTNAAELSLATPRPLPVGSNLLLQSIGRTVPLPVDTAQPHTLAAAPRWEALRDALQATVAGAGQSPVAQAVPQPGPQFTSALLFFVTALRGGDLRGWLGQEGARSIEIQGLLGRIAEEFGMMQRLANEPGGQEWRLFLIPILSGDLLHQMRLFIRDGHGPESEDKPSDETRFVIEVTFSKLGPFQFDGLARKKSLDLIIRTERDMRPQLRRAIAGIFEDTVSALGLHGSLRFRTETPFAIQPLLETGLLDEAGIVA